LRTLHEEVPAHFAALKLPGGKPVPMNWLKDALAARIPGQEDAKADARLLAKQLAVLAQNHAALTKAIANGSPPWPLLDPYAAAITAAPYANGEPFSRAVEIVMATTQFSCSGSAPPLA
jgi:hypothetical protein